MKREGKKVIKKLFNDTTGQIITQERVFETEQQAIDFIKNYKPEPGVIYVD